MSGEPPQFLEERHARLLVVDSLDPSNRSPLTAPMSRSSLRSPITEPRSKTSSEKNRPRAWTNELEVPPPGLHRDTTSRPLNSVCLLHDLNLGRFSLLSPDLYAFPLIPTVEFYKRGTRARASQSPRALESRLLNRRSTTRRSSPNRPSDKSSLGLAPSLLKFLRWKEIIESSRK